MEEKARRIVESAVLLAEQGGFEAVRLRDVAAHADVALGTLYRRFRSKEDLLIAALDLETQELERRVGERPPRGEDELARTIAFFSLATRGMLRRPNLARAMVKALASGDRELTKKVASFHERVEVMVVSALRGQPRESRDEAFAQATWGELATHLNHYWFVLMVGWTGGLHSRDDVIHGMEEIAELLLAGVRARTPRPENEGRPKKSG
jgi:AcrR family transcriptional regulator